MATVKPQKKREARPAAERAQEALDVANRVLDAAQKRLDAAKAKVTELEGEVVGATKRRDYAAQHPDLPEQPTTSAEQDLTPPEA